MADRKYEDRLKDYTDVKQRIALFYAAHPDGRLVTNRAELWMELDPPVVVVQAFAYRTPDDPFPGTGWSWMTLPGSTSFTRGAELENTETSAWGRAIGCLGIGIGAGIASVNEIAAKEGGVVTDEPPPNPDGSLIGTVAEGKPPTDLMLRDDPGLGKYCGFVLSQKGKRLQVVAVGPLAEALAPFLPGLVGQRVACYGRAEMVPWVKGGRDMPPYPRLQLERIETTDWTLPADVPPEAPSVPLFPEVFVRVDEAEAAEILRLELAEAER